MIESIIAGVSQTFSPNVLLAILVGVIISYPFAMPGLGTTVALAVTLPFTFGLNPVIALTFIVALMSACNNGGSLVAIFLGIPGTVANAATVIDGFAMTKKGEGGRAAGAALCCAAMGGIFGAAVLALLIPAAYPLVMLCGSGESSLLAMVGLAFIVEVSGESKLKGMACGLIGMLLGLVGAQPYSGLVRFNFGTTYLYEGISFIPLILGMFAIPQVIDLAMKGGTAIAEVDGSILVKTQWAQVLEGAKDVFRHWKLFIRSSMIGVLVGIMPGAGAETAIFIAYGQAKQTSKHPELFGQGIVEGVIAPESASNGKEGGAMLPTLTFGIPGSSLMAILLGAFLVHGITPGPEMVKSHLDLTFTLITTLVVANILASIFLVPFMGQIAKVAFVSGRILVPFILVTASFGAYASKGDFNGIFVMFIFGALGYGMMKFGYSRVALVLGFVLSGLAERYFLIAYGAMGFGFLLRPGSLILLIIIFIVLTSSQLKSLFRLMRKEKP